LKLIAGTTVFIAMLIGATAVDATGSRHRAWVSCGIYGRSSHSCYVGDLPYANFRDLRRSDTRYRLCVTRPSGRTICRNRTTGSRGSTQRIPLRSENVGWHYVRWLRNGRVVARWSYYMNVGD
jgi:hypothetical protein